MKITEILKEEITYADITQRYSANKELLNYIRKAGQDPRNQKDGVIDWGSAIDLGNAQYQAAKNKDLEKDDESPFGTQLGFQSAQDASIDDRPSSSLDPIDLQYRTVGGQIGNQNARKYDRDSLKWARDSFGGNSTVANKIGKAVSKVVGTEPVQALKRTKDNVKGAYNFVRGDNPSGTWNKFKQTRFKNRD